MLKLYGFAVSNYYNMVKLALLEKGLPFEEVTVPLYDEDWSNRREGDEFAPSGGKVPILWDGDDIVVWDSLAIIDYLNEGKSRSVKTLSGGQAFQVSLSLALALAESVQSNAKAEKKFFFIDEPKASCTMEGDAV